MHQRPEDPDRFSSPKPPLVISASQWTRTGWAVPCVTARHRWRWPAARPVLRAGLPGHGGPRRRWTIARARPRNGRARSGKNGFTPGRASASGVSRPQFLSGQIERRVTEGVVKKNGPEGSARFALGFGSRLTSWNRLAVCERLLDSAVTSRTADEFFLFQFPDVYVLEPRSAAVLLQFQRAFARHRVHRREPTSVLSPRPCETARRISARPVVGQNDLWCTESGSYPPPACRSPARGDVGLRRSLPE